MQKLNKIVEFIYLIIAVVFFTDAIITFSTDRNKALLLVAFAVMATFMFFFKRKVRRRNYNNPKK